MTASPPPQPPAGWYPDPDGGSGQKYWTGEAWSDVPAPESPAAPPVKEMRSGNKLFLLIIGPFLAFVALAGVADIVASHHASQPDSRPSQSPSYQTGYDSGTSGLARNTYGEEFDTSDVAKSEQYACSVAFTGEHIRNPSLTEDDYTQGCLKAFSDHPPAQKSKAR